MSGDVVPRPPSPEQRIRELETELAVVRAEYRKLQELSGQALVRAHLQRGDRELDAAKAHTAEDAARDEIRKLKEQCEELFRRVENGQFMHAQAIVREARSASEPR